MLDPVEQKGGPDDYAAPSLKGVVLNGELSGAIVDSHTIQ